MPLEKIDKVEPEPVLELPFIADPVSPPALNQPPRFEHEPDYLGAPPLSPGRQWLFEHRRMDMKPYIDFSVRGEPVYKMGLETQYPGLADKITRATDAGYDDSQIMMNITDMVEQAIDAGYSDGMIEQNLYYGYQDFGFWERPLVSFFYGRPQNILEKTWDYLGTTPKYHTDPIKHELRAVVERGISGFTGGLSDLVQQEATIPQTIPGTIAGSAANLTGFILGPLKLSKYLIGGRLAPTATGLRGVAQICTEGGATLGLAGFLSSAVPAYVENENLTDAAVDVIENTATMTLIGTLFPLSGAIESKSMRLAVGMAAMDKIRAGFGEWFTIDDVVKGVIDGTIDREELAERSFGYLMNLYFLNKVPSMKAQLAGLEKNAMVRRMLEVKSAEVEKLLVELGKAGLVPKTDPRFLDGVGRYDKLKTFGSEKNFNNIYKMLHQEQVRLAGHIQTTIAKAQKLRIPKELEPLATRALTFRKADNFVAAARLIKLKDIEKTALQETFKGDFKVFWKQAQARDAQTRHALTLYGSESATLLNALSVEKMYNAGDAELQRLNSGSMKKTYQGVARAVWDVSANVKAGLLKKGGELGKQAVIRHELIRGAGPKAARLFQEASKRIFGGLDKGDEIILNRIIQSRRTIAIARYKPSIKHPAGLGLKEHTAYLSSVPKEQFTRLSKRADSYFAEMKSQLAQLRKAGIISKESHDALVKTGDYSARHFIQHIDPERTYTFAGKKITVWDSGIKALDEGSYKTLDNNSRGLLAQVVTRTQARLFKNEANKCLYELAKQIPDNTVVQLAKVKRVTKEGKPVYAKPPAGFERLGVMIEGEMREMTMPSALTREWVVSDPAVSSQMANIIGWLSGAKILRPMATGLNPEFAITNLPRDIAHVWITTHEYSPHAPLAALQMAKDFAKTFKDTIFRRGAWPDYISEGGGMGFLTHQGRVTKKMTGTLAGFQNVMGYLGETSEIWTRLALRNRAIRNGKPPHEATWIARNYLDFSQGGWFTKGADTGIPYLNAGVQGTRGIVRAARDKPGEFLYKTAEIGTLATGLYLANRYTNPEAWESISDADKTNYFIITTPLSYIDDEGNKRHLYFRIAKDQGQKITCTLFENLMAKSLGEDIDVDQAVMAAHQFITVMPTDLVPPTMDAMLGYWSNKDFWRNEDVWKGPEVIAQEEYRAYTHPGFVKLGELTGLSPERARYALQQYFTYGNIYTSLTGGGLKLIMDELPIDVKEESLQDMLRQAPFLRRVLRSTDPFTQYAKDIKEARLADSTRKYIQTRTLDSLSELVFSGKEDDTRIRRFLAEQPLQDRQRLLERHRNYGRIYEIPDKRWWLNLMGLAPEPRATAYWTRWQLADNAERERLEGHLQKVPGVVTERFLIRLNRLKAK